MNVRGAVEGRCKARVRYKASAKTGDRSLVVMCAVVGSFDMDPTNSLNSFSLIIFVQMVGSSGGAPCCLQQSVVRPPSIVGFV